MPRMLFESSRCFQLWQAGVGHRHLLLRSPKGDADTTRVDVLFKPVDALKLRTVLSGLRILEADPDEAVLIDVEVGQVDPSTPTFIRDSKVFIIESGAFRGYVIAGVMATHEDDLEYHEPSSFFADSDSLLSP